MVGLWTLNPPVEVRILYPQPNGDSQPRNVLIL